MHPGLILGLVGLGIVVLLVILNDQSPEPVQPPAPVEQPKVQPKPKPKPVDTSYVQQGKEPKRPAPPIPAALYEKTDALYNEAKDLYAQGQTARNAGDTKTYQGHMHAAWALMEKVEAALDPYTLWLQEADMGNWRMPAEYSVLQKKLGVYDPLRTNLKRSKTLGDK